MCTPTRLPHRCGNCLLQCEGCLLHCSNCLLLCDCVGNGMRVCCVTLTWTCAIFNTGESSSGRGSRAIQFSNFSSLCNLDCFLPCNRKTRAFWSKILAGRCVGKSKPKLRNGERGLCVSRKSGVSTRTKLRSPCSVNRYGLSASLMQLTQLFAKMVFKFESFKQCY